MDWTKEKLVYAAIVLLVLIVVYLMYSYYMTPAQRGTTLLNGTVTVRVVYSMLTGHAL
ncbi:MAG TPA: hypothetical protein VGQ00_00915 [Candidatus Norongarragalinales archaeon]|jgi:hypothetical protein|nr:hypothetical protein [Candidatus Norongarragalinales archaeon]